MNLRWRSPVALMAALGIVAVACGSGSGGEPTATPSTTPGVDATQPTPTSTATPTPEPGPEQLAIGAPRSLPQGLVLYVIHGCWGCDGPDADLERLYIDGDGELRRDRLLRTPAATYIAGNTIFAPDGSIYTTICAVGYCGGIGPTEPGSRTDLVRSTDGGVTWETLEEYEAAAVGIVGALQDGLVLSISTTQTPEVSTSRYVMYPGGEELSPPPGSDAADVHPVVLGGRVLWWRQSDSMLLDSSGDTALDLKQAAGIADPGWDAGFLGEVGPGVFLIGAVSEDRTAWYVVLHREGEESLQLALAEGSFELGTLLEDEVAAGNLYVSLDDLVAAFHDVAPGYQMVDETFGHDYDHSIPALFDLAAGEAHPLELYGPLVGAAYAQDRNRVVHAERGSFLRVKTGDDDCLNVRATPGLQATVVGCYFSGVLLRDRENSETADGIEWLGVETPTGQSGWASTEFLER